MGEHVVQLLPVQGGLTFSPGWRCDADPYLTQSSTQAAETLANWPGGKACFWNCSAHPVERTIEISLSKDGLASISDDGGCSAADMLWVSTPVRVAVGCRMRGPDILEGFFKPEDSEAPTEPCSPDMSARVEWFEIKAARAERDPELHDSWPLALHKEMTK